MTKLVHLTGALLLLALLVALMAGLGGWHGQSSANASLIPFDQYGIGIEIRGDLAYVLEASSIDITIFDISNPLAPKQLAVIPDPEDGGWREFDVAGDRLYAFERIENLSKGVVHIFDVSNPRAPMELTQFRGPSYEGFGFPRLLKVSPDNRYLHLSESSTWPYVPIQIYDISDINQPKLVATYAGECYEIDLTLVGRRAYVNMGPCDGEPAQTFYIGIYDLTDPESPVLVSDERLRELTLGLNSYDIWQNHVYENTSENLGGGNRLCGIRIINVAEPTQPVLEGKIEWNSNRGCGGEVKVVDSLMYSANSEEYEPNWNVLETYERKIRKTSQSSPAINHLDSPENLFSPFNLKDDCIYWIRSNSTIGLYTICTAGLAAVAPTPTPTSIPASKQYMPFIYAE